MDREPCPFRVFDDCGTGFTMGVVAGSAFHMIQGARNAPKGDRLRMGLRTAKIRGPVLGGNFAVFSGLFSGVDCLLVKIRKEEDTFNTLCGAFIAGALLAFRGGMKSMFIGGTVAMTLIGLMDLTATKLQNAQMQEQGDMKIPPPPPITGPVQPYMYPSHREKEFDFIAGMPNSFTRSPEELGTFKDEKLNFL